MSPPSPLELVCQSDPALADVWNRLGDPPAWKRPATFATFVRIICEQQVSLASGIAIFNRLRKACDGTLNASRIVNLDDAQLKTCGLSRQKARYVRTLAEDIRSRRFSVSALASMDDENARQSIVARLGLGNWSADVYLMMALRRQDILPTGDLGLIKGLEELDDCVYQSGKEIIERAEIWRPYRSIGTKIVWSLYLHNRNRTLP